MSTATTPAIRVLDHVLLALKDGQAHRRVEVLAYLEHALSDTPCPGGRGQWLAQFRKAQHELLADARITLTRGADDSEADLFRLVPPPPDPRFAIDPVLRDCLPPAGAGPVAELERQLLTQGCLHPPLTRTHQGRPRPPDGHPRPVRGPPDPPGLPPQ